MVKQGSQRRAHAQLALLYTLEDGAAACNIMSTTHVQRLTLGGDPMIKTIQSKVPDCYTSTVSSPGMPS